MMTSMVTKAERKAIADRVLRSTVERVTRSITLSDSAGRADLRRLEGALRRAQRELERRLNGVRRVTGSERFAEAQRRAYLAQLDLVIDGLRESMRAGHAVYTSRAMRLGWDSAADVLAGLEQAFTGVAAPLRISEARVFESAMAGVRSSLLTSHATSMDRYGRQMVRRMERVLSTGMLTGATQTQMIDALVGIRGPRGSVSMAALETPAGVIRLRLEHIPEGLFKRYRYWAARIVRTETAYAQNASAHQAIVESSKQFPDMKRKILAMMDNKTAPDSIAVHGQIRAIDKPFTDGAGRVYMHPPARPNDREMVVPWRERWSETNTSRRRPARAVASAIRSAGIVPAGAPATVADLRRWISKMRSSGTL